MAITDSTQRFSSRVENYIRYRPRYPQQILEVLSRECGLTAASVVADIASGTGLLAKVFLENGNRVIGIEPNKEMREAGERLLQAYKQFSSRDGTAEATGLPDRSVDFITAGQAAHWFEREKARREFVRILKPGGWVALIWNDRSTESTPFLRDYEQLLRTYGTDYEQVRHVGLDTAEQISDFFSPARARLASFPNCQVFDYDGLQGRLLSSSYTPQENHPNFAPMLSALRVLFDKYQQNGQVTFEYETRMYFGQPQPRY